MFRKVNQITEEGLQTIWINFNHISALLREEDTTKVFWRNGQSYRIKETPEEIGDTFRQVYLNPEEQ